MLVRHSYTCIKKEIARDQLIIHADRGSSMKSKRVANLLADLGITKTHSRPYVSNDNPYSEAQFKTLKYCPSFPDQFGSIQGSRSFCQAFFAWYNDEHKHTGISLLTPAQLHYGEAKQVIETKIIPYTTPSTGIRTASNTSNRNIRMSR